MKLEVEIWGKNTVKNLFLSVWGDASQDQRLNDGKTFSVVPWLLSREFSTALTATVLSDILVTCLVDAQLRSRRLSIRYRLWKRKRGKGRD